MCKDAVESSQPTDRTSRAVHGLAVGMWVAFACLTAGKNFENPANHSTYPLFQRAAVQWWEGVNVYDQNVFDGDYRYGPSFAMVLGPIAWLPIRIGCVVWALVNVGIAYWAISALARRVLPHVQSPLGRSMLLLTSLFPSAHCLYSCQTNLLVFSLVAFATIAILDERWWLAALLLAIPVHIKVWPLAAGLLFAACWPRRLAWRLPIALAAIAALPLLAKSPAAVCEQYVQWYRHLAGPSQIRHTYRDAWTIWELVSKPVDQRLYNWLQLTAAAGVLGLCLWKARQGSPRRTVLLVLACWTAWQLVFGPGTERNTFALIAPLTGWAIVVAFWERRGRLLMTSAYLLTVLAAAIGGMEDVHPALKVMHPVGILLFFAWFLHREWRGGADLGQLALEVPAGGLI